MVILKIVTIRKVLFVVITINGGKNMENKVYEVVLSYTVDDGDIERLQDYEKNVICFSKEVVDRVINDEADRYINFKGFSINNRYGNGTKSSLIGDDGWGHPAYVDFRVYERKDGEWGGTYTYDEFDD